MVSEPGCGRLGSRKTRGKRCRVKTGNNQTVLGVSRDVLNRALWWFMVALLVTCALADQNSESLLVGPKYAVDKDGRCWGILGKWLCLSWGTAKVPVLEEVLEQETLEPELACDIVHCYVQKGVDLIFETLGIFLDNPISLWTAGMELISTALIEKFPLIWKMAGVILLIVMLNMMAFVYLRVAVFFVRIWKLFKWICGWPLFALIVGTLRCIYNFWVSIPQKAEEERKKKEKKDKEANAVWQSSRRFFKEFGDRLAEAEKKGIFDDQAEESKEGEQQKETPIVAACPHCGQKGHEGEVCQLRYEAVHHWRRPYQGKQKQRKLPKEKFAEEPLSTRTNPDEGPSRVSMVCVEGQTAFHTPVWINGVKIPRCLIDTGAEVNLISVRDAIKYGFSYNLGGIQKIRGFNGGISAVDGTMECDMRLGPCGEPRRVEFFVSSASTIPIIGCHALSELDIRMDCQERILFDDAGNVVRCSAMSALKN